MEHPSVCYLFILELTNQSLNLTLQEQMMKLRPIKVPKRIPKSESEAIPSDGAGDHEGNGKPKDLTSLTKDTNKLLNDLYKMCATPRVINITKRKPGM